MSSVENIDDDLMTHEELLELQAYAQLQRENGTHQKSQREPKEFICQSVSRDGEEKCTVLRIFRIYWSNGQRNWSWIRLRDTNCRFPST